MAIGNPTLCDLPTTQAFLPMKSGFGMQFCRIFNTANGVQGTNEFPSPTPWTRFPRFRLVNPSTSFPVVTVLQTSCSSKCFGIGSWIIIPWTDRSWFKSLMVDNISGICTVSGNWISSKSSPAFKGQLISKKHCFQIDQKTNEILSGFLPWHLKRGQIKKIRALSTTYWIFVVLTWPLFRG